MTIRPLSRCSIEFTAVGFGFLAAAVALAVMSAATSAADESSQDIVVYHVGRKVSDFSLEDDFSSPEAAYATICRQVAAGDGDWIAVSCNRLRQDLAVDSYPMERPTAEVAQAYRSAEILQTRIFDNSYAQVAARLPRGNRPTRPIDVRAFELENGRWLNAGNDNATTLDEAARIFARQIRRRQELDSIQTREPIRNPDAILAEHVAYLREHGEEPKDFVLQALAHHQLVAIGEIHHRPIYWRLNCEVVEDPRFAQIAGTIYLELPMHAQPLVDEFLAADRLDAAKVVAVLRDNLWMGWPDQAMLDFFTTVWQVNQTLDADQRIRIVLVDMKRPWREMIREGSPRKYDVDRDKLMSENILADVERRGKGRHALFIVGFAHLENVRVAGADGRVTNVGYYLRDRLGAGMFSIVQHGPVLSNMGQVYGRTNRGIFDEAFRANDNSPVSFSLNGSRFGQHRYDLNGDLHESSMSRFEEAFDGYIFLSRLEDENFSSLIPGFYSDEVVHELDQRHRLEFGVGLQEGLGLSALDGRSFEKWMRSWGRPREWRHRLGPVTAWREGDQADTYLFWCEEPAPSTIDAVPSSREGIMRLVDECFQHNWRDITARKTVAWGPLNIGDDNNASISYRFEATTAQGTSDVTWVFTFTPTGGLLSLKDETARRICIRARPQADARPSRSSRP